MQEQYFVNHFFHFRVFTDRILEKWIILLRASIMNLIH
jgi:hypothetical protein